MKWSSSFVVTARTLLLEWLPRACVQTRLGHPVVHWHHYTPRPLQSKHGRYEWPGRPKRMSSTCCRVLKVLFMWMFDKNVFGKLQNGFWNLDWKQVSLPNNCALSVLLKTKVRVLFRHYVIFPIVLIVYITIVVRNTSQTTAQIIWVIFISKVPLSVFSKLG